MAEHLTVDQVVVGSTPIWHPLLLSCYCSVRFCILGRVRSDPAAVTKW
jgi:hypothetical protein